MYIIIWNSQRKLSVKVIFIMLTKNMISSDEIEKF